MKELFTFVLSKGSGRCLVVGTQVIQEYLSTVEESCTFLFKTVDFIKYKTTVFLLN